VGMLLEFSVPDHMCKIAAGRINTCPSHRLVGRIRAPNQRKINVVTMSLCLLCFGKANFRH
jgi:hypothetical protein